MPPVDPYKIIDYYVKAYHKRYGVTPVVNRYKSKWGIEAMLSGMTAKDAKELIDFYFKTFSDNKHDIDWFIYNYEKLIESKADFEEDERNRAAIRERSRLRSEEWRKTHKTLGN